MCAQQFIAWMKEWLPVIIGYWLNSHRGCRSCGSGEQRGGKAQQSGSEEKQ